MPVFFRGGDVFCLGPLAASGEKQHTRDGGQGIIDAVSRTDVEFQLENSIPNRPENTEITESHSVDSMDDAGDGGTILKGSQLLNKWCFAIISDVVFDVVRCGRHNLLCNLKVTISQGL